jgi:hypothetical protein
MLLGIGTDLTDATIRSGRIQPGSLADSQSGPREEAKADKLTIKPEKFKPEEWHNFGSAFLTYLSNHQGAQYSPLDYVTLLVVAVTHVHTTERDRLLYQYPLTGALYREDNRAVFCMLADLLMGTKGYT